ncbi:MAG TPA: acyl-CoA dehydrogenase family protein [Thermoanaerobaculia bacterium]|nr:acyl-CoA dehydrogenase family protein [Thermoanaerobaculia bacterium]
MLHPYGVDPTEDVLVAAGEISAKVAAPRAAAVDSSADFPSDTVDALRRQGFLGLCVARELGGRGAGPRTFAAVTEELAMSCPSSAMIYVMHVTAAQAIASSAILRNRDDLLRQIAEGKHLTTLAFSEKGSRSQFWSPVSRLEEDDGHYVTTASKSWVTAAGHADSYVSSSQKPDAQSSLESTVYLVRKSTDGVRVSSSFNGLGLRGNDSSPIDFERVTIARDDLISASGDGPTTILQVVLPWFAVGTAAMANGICRAAVTRTAEHLSTAGFEHKGALLRDLPTLRARLAQMSVRTDQSRALLGYTLSHLEQPSDITPLYVLEARLAALEAAVDVTDLAMKACGGAAFSRHLPLERYFRDARAGWVMAPTVDHLNDFIGRALTGMPLF